MELVTPDPDLVPDEFAMWANLRTLQETLTARGLRVPLGSRLQPSIGFRNPSLNRNGLYGEYDSDTLTATVGIAADRVLMRPAQDDAGMVVEFEPAGIPDVDVAAVRISLHGTDVSEGNDTLTRWDFIHGDEYKQTTYSRVGGSTKDFLWTKDVDGTETELMRLTTAGVFTVLGSGFQPLDATLTAFAALTIAANSLTIGTGADAFSQTTFAANTFPARASTGNLVAKTITDFGLSLVDDATASAGRDTLGAASGIWGLAIGGTAADLSATGGASQVLRQSSAGAAITVSQLAAADISDFSEAVDDRVSALLVEGTNITLTYDDGANTLTIDASGSGGGPLTVEAHTVDDTLTSGETGSLHTNQAAGGLVVLTLPAAAAGIEFYFQIVTAATLRITAGAADTVEIAGSTTAAAGNIAQNTVGHTVHLIAIDDTRWVAQSVIGTWTVT